MKHYKWIAAFFVVLVVAAVPQKYIPERLVPFVATKGSFTREPVRFSDPISGRPDAMAYIRIGMDDGACQVSIESDAGFENLFSMGKGNCRLRIQQSSELVLDPGGKTGSYEINIGPEWHPLAPKGRRCILLPIAMAVILILLIIGKTRKNINKLMKKRVFFIIATAGISALLLYPIVHEGGHILFGMLSGGRPDWSNVVWTPLGGYEPHVSFSYLPQNAAAFMSAGGTIVPTVFALLLLIIWKFIHRKASWYTSAALLLISIGFFFSTMACPLQLYRNEHMDALSVHLGLTGPFRVLFTLSPLFVAVIACAWLCTKLPKSGLGKAGSKRLWLKNQIAGRCH